MATLLIKSEKQITRQEGDDSDIVFTVPGIFPLTDSTVEFSIFQAGRKIIRKLTSDVDITDQVITVPLLASDTKGKSGSHRWELQITRGGKITTIGKGSFNILAELIK